MSPVSDPLVRLRFADGQFCEWRGFCDEIWELDTNKEADAPFGVEVCLKRIGRSVLSTLMVAFGGLSIGRAPWAVDSVGLTVVQRGRSVLVSGDTEYVIGPGHLCLVRGGEPFEKRIVSGDYHEYFLRLPCHGYPLLETVPGPAFTARRGIGAVLADFVVALTTHVVGCDSLAVAAVEQSALAMVAAAFERRELVPARRVTSWPVDVSGPEPSLEDWIGRMLTYEHPVREQQRARILMYIDSNLQDASLSPRQIAAAHRMSVRYLHRLFEDTPDTLASTILARRLDRCIEDLGSPERRGLRISDIAFSWGFGDAAHFSRAFRARFGMTPREARERFLGRHEGTRRGVS